MTLHHFPRDLIFFRRITERAISPCETKVFDFPVNGCTSSSHAHVFIADLANTFDAFRTLLHLNPGQGLFARLSDPTPPQIHIVNISSLESEVVAADRFKEIHQPQIDLFRGPPVIFYYYRSPVQGRSLLRILCSHFAIDFVTYRLVTQALRFFQNPPASHTQINGDSYLKWMDVYHDYARSAAGAEELKFWQLFPTAFFGLTRGMLPEAKNGAALRINFTIPVNMMTTLRHLAQYHWKCRLTDSLAAAVLLAIGRELDISTVPVNWTSHGRYPVSGHNFSNTAGWLSSPHPLLIPINDTGLLGATRSLRSAIHQLPTWGSTYSWVMRFRERDYGSELTHLLHAPITINLRERMLPPGIPSRHGSKNFPKITKAVIPAWSSASSIYVTIDAGITTNITVTCVDTNRLGERLEKIVGNAVSYLWSEAERAEK